MMAIIPRQPLPLIEMELEIVTVKKLERFSIAGVRVLKALQFPDSRLVCSREGAFHISHLNAPAIGRPIARGSHRGSRAGYRTVCPDRLGLDPNKTLAAFGGTWLSTAQG